MGEWKYIMPMKKEKWIASHCDQCDSMYHGDVCPICKLTLSRIAFEVEKIEKVAIYGHIGNRAIKETQEDIAKGLTHKQISAHRNEVLKELRLGATGYQRGHRHKQPSGMHIVRG